MSRESQIPNYTGHMGTGTHNTGTTFAFAIPRTNMTILMTNPAHVLLCGNMPTLFLVHLSQRLKCTIVITRCPSSVCLSVCLSVRRPSLTFHIFDFSSETAEQNSTKLDSKQELNILYQVCVFRADRKNKMAALASDWLRHFRLLL